MGETVSHREGGVRRKQRWNSEDRGGRRKCLNKEDGGGKTQ